MTPQTTLPSHLTSGHDAPCYDADCRNAVRRNPANARFYITIDHAGFNTSANNSVGYKRASDARAVLRRYTAKRSADLIEPVLGGPRVPQTDPVDAQIAHAVALTLEAAFEDGERREDLGDRTGLPALATARLRMVGAGESAGAWRVYLENGEVHEVAVTVKRVK